MSENVYNNRMTMKIVHRVQLAAARRKRLIKTGIALYVLRKTPHPPNIKARKVAKMDIRSGLDPILRVADEQPAHVQLDSGVYACGLYSAKVAPWNGANRPGAGNAVRP